MKCRFCERDAVALYSLSEGCFCCPNEHEHGYCIPHILRANPRGGMELKEVLIPEMYDFYKEWQNIGRTNRTTQKD